MSANSPREARETVTIEPMTDGAMIVRQLVRRLSPPLELPCWNLRAAKQGFSQLFRAAVETHRPQRVSRRGGGAVIVVDERDFLALLQQAPRAMPMADYFEAVAPAIGPLEPLPRRSPRDAARL